MKKLIGLNIALLLLLSGFVYKQYTELKRIKSTSILALYGTYCNQYNIRANTHFSTEGNWDGYVMFPPVCNVQYAYERVDAVKFRGDVPKYKEFVTNYDSFFTGTGYNGKNVDKAHNKNRKRLVKIYEKLVKDLGVTKSIKSVK